MRSLHHYQFAHVALRTVSFQDPAGMFALLASERAQEFMASLLRQVDEHVAGKSGPLDFEASALDLHRLSLKGHPCAVIEMPPPRRMGEAHYVALVLLEPTSGSFALRYFTLEHSTATGAVTTVLGEWVEGSHLNRGRGPAPALGAFLNAVSALLT